VVKGRTEFKTNVPGGGENRGGCTSGTAHRRRIHRPAEKRGKKLGGEECIGVGCGVRCGFKKFRAWERYRAQLREIAKTEENQGELVEG